MSLVGKSARETAHSSSGRSTGTVISPPPGALTTYVRTPKLEILLHPGPDAQAIDECSHHAGRLRRDVGPREDRRERGLVFWDAWLRVLAEHTVYRRRLGAHREDAPPPPGVRERGGSAKKRVKRGDLEAD